MQNASFARFYCRRMRPTADILLFARLVTEKRSQRLWFVGVQCVRRCRSCLRVSAQPCTLTFLPMPECHVEMARAQVCPQKTPHPFLIPALIGAENRPNYGNGPLYMEPFLLNSKCQNRRSLQFSATAMFDKHFWQQHLLL